jgi:hypothetical protein
MTLSRARSSGHCYSWPISGKIEPPSIAFSAGAHVKDANLLHPLEFTAPASTGRRTKETQQSDKTLTLDDDEVLGLLQLSFPAVAAYVTERARGRADQNV